MGSSHCICRFRGLGDLWRGRSAPAHTLPNPKSPRAPRPCCAPGVLHQWRPGTKASREPSRTLGGVRNGRRSNFGLRGPAAAPVGRGRASRRCYACSPPSARWDAGPSCPASPPRSFAPASPPLLTPAPKGRRPDVVVPEGWPSTAGRAVADGKSSCASSSRRIVLAVQVRDGGPAALLPPIPCEARAPCVERRTPRWRRSHELFRRPGAMRARLSPLPTPPLSPPAGRAPAGKPPLPDDDERPAAGRFASRWALPGGPPGGGRGPAGAVAGGSASWWCRCFEVRALSCIAAAAAHGSLVQAGGWAGSSCLPSSRPEARAPPRGGGEG